MILREETQRQYTGKEGKEGKGKPSGLVAACVVKREEYIPVVFVKPSQTCRPWACDLERKSRSQHELLRKLQLHAICHSSYFSYILNSFSLTGNLIFHFAIYYLYMGFYCSLSPLLHNIHMHTHVHTHTRVNAVIVNKTYKVPALMKFTLYQGEDHSKQLNR